MTATKNSSFQAALSDVVRTQESLEFVPSDEQRKLKAKFWTSERENPTSDPDLVSAALVAEVTNSSKVQTWWSVPGFRDWFINKNETRQKAEYVFSLLLDSIEGIAMETNPKAFSNQIAAFKMLGEYLGHFGKAKLPAALPLPSDPAELEALVQTMTKRLGVKGE